MIGDVPLHVPGLAVSVLPAAFVPLVVGSAVLDGATAARVVIAAAVPTATSASAAATSSAFGACDRPTAFPGTRS